MDTVSAPFVITPAHYDKRDVLEKEMKSDECDMEEFVRLEISEKMIAILGDRWWPQTVKQEGNRINKQFYVIYGKIVMSVQTLEVSLLGVRTVLRLESDAWSMVKWLRQATNEYAPPPPLPHYDTSYLCEGSYYSV